MTTTTVTTTKQGVFHPEFDLVLLRPSKTNPRKHFDLIKLEELASSLREHGIIQPLTARRLKGSNVHYEIVAGERRYRAAQLAHLTAVPVLERELTDEQVVEIQLIENIQRDDLTALEQARGYRALIDSNPGKHTAASIATRVGMSEAWVWDRLKLNDLVQDAKNLLEQDRMSTGHAILIARLKPGDQQRVIDPGDRRNAYDRNPAGLWENEYSGLRFEDDTPEVREKRKKDKYDSLKPVSVRELERWIAEHIRFDVAHAAKAVPLEFAPVAQQVQQAEERPGRGKKLIAITFSHQAKDDAKDPSERTYGFGSWERADGQAKSKTCEYSVLGVVSAGLRHYGKTLEVCIARDKCKVHFGKVIAQKEKTATLRDAGQPKKAAANESAQREKERKADEARMAKRKAWEALEPAIEAEMLAQVKTIKKLSAAHAKLIGLADVYNIDRQLTAAIGKSWFTKPVTAWLVLVLNSARGGYASFEEYVKFIAKPLGMNIKKLEAIRDQHNAKA